MFDAVKFFKDHGQQVNFESKNVHKGWIGIKCPFCNDHSDHLGFSLIHNYFKCWICGHHSVPEVIKTFLGISWKEAYNIWNNYSDDTPHSIVQKEKIRAKFIDIPKEPLSKYDKIYLEDRGYDWKILVEKYDLRSGGISGRWKFHIIIPIYQNGNIVTFTSRAIADSMSPRYLSLKPEESIIAIKETLFNLDNCKKNTIVVVEGPFDVMRLGDNCCAAYNTDLTAFQIELLLNYKKILLCFDNDKAAQIKAKKYGEMLASFNIETEIICLDTGKDIGELSEKGATKLRNELGIGL